MSGLMCWNCDLVMMDNIYWLNGFNENVACGRIGRNLRQVMIIVILRYTFMVSWSANYYVRNS